jgi:hypothetical protein
MCKCCQAFLSEVVRDDEYMNKTWEVTPKWNASLRSELAARFPSWKVRVQMYDLQIWEGNG